MTIVESNVKKNVSSGERCVDRVVRRRSDRPKLSISFDGHPSMTQEAHRDQTDVNAIVARFQRTGYLPEDRKASAQYLDVSEMQGRDLCDLYNHALDTATRVNEFMRERENNQEEIPDPPEMPPPAAEPTTQPGA